MLTDLKFRDLHQKTIKKTSGFHFVCLELMIVCVLRRLK